MVRDCGSEGGEGCIWDALVVGFPVVSESSPLVLRLWCDRFGFGLRACL